MNSIAHYSSPLNAIKSLGSFDIHGILMLEEPDTEQYGS